MNVRFDRLPTEQRHPRSTELDRLTTRQIVALMTDDGQAVLTALKKSHASIANGVERIVDSLRQGGRLFFIGAGTSGRLGVLEAAECPPTFDTPSSHIRGIMAGGRSAVFHSKEGVEDSERAGTQAIQKQVRPGDVVVGVAASGITPYVQAALKEAKRRHALTIFVTCNPDAGRRSTADVVISLATGPEILSGSTRLKAGTACKMALNILTTASMVRLGKVYGNRMVDLQPKSRKLVARGIRLIEMVGHVSPVRAKQLYQQSKGRVKIAIVMARLKIDRREAIGKLTEADGVLRTVIG